VCFHIRDDLYSPETGRVDMAALRPIGLLAGHLYTRLDLFEMTRKEVDYWGYPPPALPRRSDDGPAPAEHGGLSSDDT